MQSEKQLLRKTYKEQRERFFQNQQELHAASSKIIEAKVLSFINHTKLRKICCFSAIKSEVYTSGLIEKLLAAKHRIFLPVMQAERKLVARELRADLPLEKQLETEAKFQIPEPKAQYCKAYYGAIDIILTPGLVFDDTGNRIGYGGGYYDTFLAEHGEAIALGIFFHFQKHDNLSSVLEEGYDKKLLHIITEKKEYLNL